MEKITKDLMNLKDDKYQKFQASLIPNIDASRVIGVRIPILRNYAKSILGGFIEMEFKSNLPHYYYEENTLHMMLLSLRKDIEVIEEIDSFLDYVDNWATCDIPLPKVFCKFHETLKEYSFNWIRSNKTYKVRYGIRVIMTYLLDDNPSYYIDIVSKIKSNEYYINMMISWFMAFSATKYYDEVIKILESKALDRWTHNKAISKCIDSYVIEDEKKTYLKSLRY